MMAQYGMLALQLCIAKKPYFCDFSGRGSGPPVSPLDPPMLWVCRLILNLSCTDMPLDTGFFGCQRLYGNLSWRQMQKERDIEMHV